MTRRCLLLLVAVGAGCAGGPPDEEVGARAAAASRPVTWMNAVGVSAVDNELKKTAPETLWNAGAASVETLTGDGFVQFSTRENSTRKMVGLSSGDAGQHFSDIDFAVHLDGTGSVDIYQAGVEVAADVATYAQDDSFRVQVLAGVVTYWHNGSLLYTSTATPTFPLVVDTSLRTPGATVQHVFIEDLGFWTNAVGVGAVANDLSKTAPETTWKAGASSLASFEGDGYVEFTTGERNTEKLAGLNRIDNGQGFQDIDFGIYLRSNGRLAVREKGVDPVGSGFGPYQAGDVFRVEVSGGVVAYARNGSVFYTSALAPTFPLHLDTSLRTPGATILDARVVPAGDCSVWTETLSQTTEQIEIDADGDWLAVSVVAAQTYLAMYRRGAAGWVREQQIVRTPSPIFAHDRVAIDGDTVAVGTAHDSTFGSGEGLVRTYRYDGAEWALESQFAGCPNAFGDEGFGHAVGLHDDVMVVSRQYPSRRAYVYRRNGSTWRRDAMLVPSDGPAAYRFGTDSVAIGGDRIFVAARDRTVDGVPIAGAIYVFRYDASLPDPGSPPTCGAPHQGKWVEEAILHSPNPQSADRFPSGMDVDSTGTLLLSGNDQHGWEPDDEPRISNGPGEAYVFSRTAGGWVLSQTLVGSGTVDGDDFGRSVDLGGPDPASPSFAIVGAPVFGPGDDNGSDSPPGAAHLFLIDGATWSELDRLESPEPLRPYLYGEGVAASDSDVFVIEPDRLGPSVYAHDVSMCVP